MKTTSALNLKYEMFMAKPPYPRYFGAIGTLYHAAQTFWGPGMHGDITRWVKNCQEYLAKIRGTNAKDCKHQPV